MTTDHILSLQFVGHPDTHLKGREWDIRKLGRRLAQCTADKRGGRIWMHYIRVRGLFATAWLGDYSRDTLLNIQTLCNNKKFTRKGKPTRAFLRELVDTEGFQWDNAAWDRTWNSMSVAERAAHFL